MVYLLRLVAQDLDAPLKSVPHDVVDNRTLGFPDVHDVGFRFTRVRRASWLICSGYEMTPVEFETTLENRKERSKKTAHFEILLQLLAPL